MADVPILVCTAGALAGRRFVVPEGGLDLGRAKESGVVIVDEGVSRYHARILYDDGRLWLQDAGSRNGVFVNGSRVTGHRALKVGDEVRIAEHVFSIAQAAEDASRTSETAAAPAAAVGASKGAEGASAKGAGGRWWWPFS